MAFARDRARNVAVALGLGLVFLLAGCEKEPATTATDPQEMRKAELRALVHIRLALTNMESGQYETAAEGFTEALHVLPDCSEVRPAVYCSRADAYRLQGCVLEALADYDQALTLNPEDPDSYLGRGAAYASFAPIQEENAYLLLLAQQDFERAQQLATRAGGQNAQEMAQEARRFCKQIAEAREQAVKELTRQDRDVDARSLNAFKEAHALLWQGKTEAAEKLLAVAIELQRDFAAAYCARGFCRLREERVEPARLDLAKCLELRHDYEPAKHLMAILEARGMDSKALASKNREELAAQIRRHGFPDGQVDQVAIRVRRLEQGWRGLSKEERIKCLMGPSVYGDKIVPLIVERMQSERRQAVRERYMTVLSMIGTPHAADALTQLQATGDLADTSATELIAKARAMSFPAPVSQTDAIGRLIAKRGESDVAQLLDAYKAEADRVAQDRFAVGGFLALASVLQATGEAAVPGLIEMLRDPRYTSAREQTAQVLGFIGDPRAVACLQELLDGGTDDEDVLTQVKWALRQLGARAEPAEGTEERVIARLIEQLSESHLPSRSGFLKRQDAGQKLVQFGPPAVGPMVDYVLNQTTKNLFFDWDPGCGIARIARDHPDSPEPTEGVRRLLDAYCGAEPGRGLENLAGIGWTLIRLDEELSRFGHADNPLRPLLAANADRVQQAAARHWRRLGVKVPTESMIRAAEKWKKWRTGTAGGGASDADK